MIKTQIVIESCDMIVEFGDGDIYMNVATADDKIMLMVYQGENVGVGGCQKDHDKKPPIDSSFPLRLIFKCEQSLDIFINQLTRLKKFWNQDIEQEVE